MDSKYEISVVIPVFNRQGIVKKTIEGLNRQTIDSRRFEVIFVDDNSSDNTIESIKESIGNNITYKILKREINSGCASIPRNDGLSVAQGKYVFFIDSDDTIEPELLNDALSLAEKNKSDIVYIKIKSDTGRAVAIRPYRNGTIDNASIAKNHLLRSCAVFKLFNREFLEANKLRFPTDIKVGEDKIFMTYALAKAKKVSILANKAYINACAHEGEHLSRHGNLLDGFETRQKAIDYIATSDIELTKKEELYNAWLVLCIEALIRMSISKDRPVYFEYIFKKLAFAYNQYRELLDLSQIYKEYQDFIYPLLYGDMVGFVIKAKEFKNKSK